MCMARDDEYHQKLWGKLARMQNTYVVLQHELVFGHFAM